MSKQPRPRRRAKGHDISAKSRAYRQLWRVVDGAVFDALYTHQDYLTEKGRIAARGSIVKRVTGAVIGFAEQSAQGRSEAISAADRETARQPFSRMVRIIAMSKGRAALQTVARLFRGVSA